MLGAGRCPSQGFVVGRTDTLQNTKAAQRKSTQGGPYRRFVERYWTMLHGFMFTLPWRTSKCKWTPVEFPVLPAMPTT